MGSSCKMWSAQWFGESLEDSGERCYPLLCPHPQDCDVALMARNFLSPPSCLIASFWVWLLEWAMSRCQKRNPWPTHQVSLELFLGHSCDFWKPWDLYALSWLVTCQGLTVTSRPENSESPRDSMKNFLLSLKLLPSGKSQLSLQPQLEPLTQHHWFHQHQCSEPLTQTAALHGG